MNKINKNVRNSYIIYIDKGIMYKYNNGYVNVWLIYHYKSLQINN